MAILREKSIKFGGAQYIRKRTNETAQCEVILVISVNSFDILVY